MRAPRDRTPDQALQKRMVGLNRALPTRDRLIA